MDLQTAPLIAHIIYRLDVGGLENGLVNLINHMPRDRYRHVIVCLAGYSDFKTRLMGDDVIVVSIDKKPGKDLPSYWRLWLLLRKLKPEIVHTRNLGTVDLQWVAWAAGVKHRVHGEHGWEAADPMGENLKNLRIRRACRWLVQRYVAVSQNLATWLSSKVGVAPSRIAQIYNGVDAVKFAPDGSLPQDHPWRGGEFVFGTVGRLDPIKNQLTMLDAFDAVVRSSPHGANLRLTIVGGGPLSERLRERVAQLGLGGQVWLTGVRSDIADLMRTFDVFVLPSLNEGISNTILEAMASSRAVIAGRVGGNPELIQHEHTGYLYAANSRVELEAALSWYANEKKLAEAQGAAARAHVLAQFSLNSMMERYLQVYDGVFTGT